VGKNGINLQHPGDVRITREVSVVSASRRKVLVAALEYNIDDWNIKVKIGGFGVMAQLMGKALFHIDLAWVVPCTEGIEYPDNEDERAESWYFKSWTNFTRSVYITTQSRILPYCSRRAYVSNNQQSQFISSANG
jgi:hypothetical protein